MALNTLWASLNPNLGVSKMKPVAEKLISQHSARDWWTLMENQNEAPMENTLMKLQCLFCYTDTGTMSKWLANGETEISKVVGLIERIVSYAAVPEFKGREDIGFNAEDFAGISTKAEIALKVLQSLLDILQLLARESDGEKQVKYHELIEGLFDKSILLVLEHCNDDNLWTSQGCTESAKELLEGFVTFRKKSSFASLLCDDMDTAPGYFHCLSKRLLPRLSKSSWKQNPGACKAFIYCLHEIKFPSTSMFLDQLLPPALLFSDDHELEYKIMGAKSLHHIVQNTSAGELSWFNRIDVIYSSLERLLYTHEPESLSVVLPCMLDLLRVFQKLHPLQEGSVREFTKHNDIFLRLLSDMHLENNLAPRRIYAQYLARFIELLGIGIVWHFKKLFAVIGAFLEISDGRYEEARLDILDVLKCCIEVAWPRISPKCRDILLMLVPIIYELAANRGIWAEGVKEKLLGKCERIIILLNKVDHKKVSVLLAELTSVKTLPDCDAILSTWQDLCTV